MKRQAKKITIQVIAIFFLLVGLAGLVLPILNGIFFLIVGLLLLSLYSSWAQKLLTKLGKTHPKVEQTISRAENWIRRHVGEL